MLLRYSHKANKSSAAGNVGQFDRKGIGVEWREEWKEIDSLMIRVR